MLGWGLCVATVALSPNGRLPVGRWTCSMSDLDVFHQLPDQTYRAAVWSEWETLTNAVRAAVGRVPAVWLGGSYFTDKDQPGDVDCVYVLDREDVDRARLDPTVAAFLQAVAGSAVKQHFGLRVDSYVLPWWPRPGTRRGTDDRRLTYLESRGYWDELWLRDRGAGPGRLQQVPARGYVEVILDGYV
jgi:hypothetical protein